MKKQNKIDRRNFLKTVAAAGLAPAFVSTEAMATTNDANTSEAQEAKFPQVPKRKLGKTGVDVPCLSLGASFNTVENQAVLRGTLQWGVNYWDTSNISAGGNSELGIGKFILNNPKLRKDLFIVSKAAKAETVAEVEERLAGSLKRMNTKYIDLYYGAYMLSDPAGLTDELKQWAQSAKKRKLIRFFGFSTHKNSARCLAAAAKLGWIDAIMLRYSFRSMQDAELKAAIDTCHKAGIGLIAMKTQAKGAEPEESETLVQHFLQKGFTDGQAKVKAVLHDGRFCSACVKMENIALLTSNVAAVLDKTELTQADMKVFRQYAQATCSGYCAGCADICDAALPDTPYVSDIMRYLMYYNSYGDRQHARELFAQIPDSVRNKLLAIDYSVAETRCPQRIPIAKLVAEAVRKLA